jgi:ABC-type multidrug transport system fused ATPase/permease subunit
MTTAALRVSPSQRLPWQQIRTLLSPSRRALTAMLALSLAGSLAALVPPLALGRLVDALAGHATSAVAAAWVGAAALAVIAEGAAYAASDVFYARAAARACRELRLWMFDGLERLRLGSQDRATLATRFVSDVETLEEVTVAALDRTALAVFDLLAPLVALAILAGRLVGVAALGAVIAAYVLQRLRRPASAAGEWRQETLERMSEALATPAPTPAAARQRFVAAVRAVADAESRLGWIGAVNHHGSAVAAGLGPLLVVLAGAASGKADAGTLLTVYLLASRAFGAVETLLDGMYGIAVARGAIARCFALVGPRRVEAPAEARG